MSIQSFCSGAAYAAAAIQVFNYFRTDAGSPADETRH